MKITKATVFLHSYFVCYLFIGTGFKTSYQMRVCEKSLINVHTQHSLVVTAGLVVLGFV